MNCERVQQGRRGQASMETALVLVAFIPIIFGSVDFARAFYDQVNLGYLSREGARKAAICQNAAKVQTAVQNAAVLTQVSSVTVSTPTAVGQQVTVTVQTNFVPITPIVGDILGARTLSDSTALTAEAIDTTCAPPSP